MHYHTHIITRTYLPTYLRPMDVKISSLATHQKDPKT